MKKILILYAHPAQEASEVNAQLAKSAMLRSDTTLVDLYAEYPTGFIDVSAEQARLKKHDIIIFLHPFYWYSTPPILKLWQDMVLEYRFAYGKNGNKLKEKIFFSTLSAAGAKKAYKKSGSNHFTIRQLLAPLEQTANLCEMQYLPPFVLYDARTSYEKDLIEGHVKKWNLMLDALSSGRVTLSTASKLDTLNQAVIKKVSNSKAGDRK